MIFENLLILTFFASSLAQTEPSLSCDYTMAAGEYTCLYTINNPDGFDEFEGIQGTHMDGMTDANVTSVVRAAGNSTIAPSIFCTQFPNLRTLNLQMTGIQSVTNNPFGACNNLIWLRLWSNRISEIAADTFANNGGLTYLDLDTNLLTTLNVNTFQGLNNLVTLELRNNNLEDRIPSGLFRPLTSLRVLYMNNCGLPSINRAWFETLSQLTQLWIYNNNLTRVVTDQFVGLPNLQYVDLDGNQIQVVERRAFYLRENLQAIYLYNNLIEEIFADTFEAIPNLVYIDLDRNRINNIEDGAFRTLTNLTTLYMDENRIKHLSNRTFEGIPNLINLFMNFNEIEDLPDGVFTPLQSLTRLGLWNNSIKILHRSYFGDLSSLNYIDVDNNVINGLERSVLEEAVNLQTLYFWNNLCFSGSMFNFETNRVNFMLMLERCFDNHRFMIDTTTEGDMAFRFFSFPNPGIQLRVNAPQDAHISLNPLNMEAVPRIEIHIGVQNNTRSIIRRNGSENVVDVSTPGILERDSWTGFRIVYANWMVLVFREGETFPFMVFSMTEWYPINFYGIRTPGSIAPWSIQPIG